MNSLSYLTLHTPVYNSMAERKIHGSWTHAEMSPNFALTFYYLFHLGQITSLSSNLSFIHLFILSFIIHSTQILIGFLPPNVTRIFFIHSIITTILILPNFVFTFFFLYCWFIFFNIASSY